MVSDLTRDDARGKATMYGMLLHVPMVMKATPGS